MVRVLLLAIVAATAVACENDHSRARDSENVPADNTKKNERDREGKTLTPIDQKENDVDRTITQQIRQAVAKDDTLGMSAKNIKIITVDGVVTLRGPVKDNREKALVDALASQVDGVKRVDDQLEVASK